MATHDMVHVRGRRAFRPRAPKIDDVQAYLEDRGIWSGHNGTQWHDFQAELGPSTSSVTIEEFGQLVEEYAREECIRLGLRGRLSATANWRKMVRKKRGKKKKKRKSHFIWSSDSCNCFFLVVSFQLNLADKYFTYGC